LVSTDWPSLGGIALSVILIALGAAANRGHTELRNARAEQRGKAMAEEYRDDDDDAGRSLLHRAVGRGDIETASRLLEAEPSSIHNRNEIDNQPLHEACWEKHPSMCRLLIDCGADVNARGDFGQTALHFAVRDGGDKAVEIVAMLVQAGADVDAKDDRLQENPLGFALREYKDELKPAMRLLRKKGGHAEH
jgi:Ankyrin repeats (3 copies)/Ankyrin repeat